MSAKWVGILVLGLSSMAFAEASTPMEEARQKMSVGDKEKAAIFYRQALQVDNTNEVARHELAAIIVESQIAAPYAEQSDVMTILENNMADPVFPSVSFSLAFLNNGALTAYDEPMNREVLLALQKLQNNDNESAIKIATTLHKKYPQHPVPYNLLGLAWQGKGDPSQAHDFFEKALALNENFYAARINLAELELHLGEFKSAHQALDAVLKSDIHNRRACLVKAHLYTLEQKPQLAKLWYFKVSETL